MGRSPQLQGSHSKNLQLLGAGMNRLGQAPAGGKEGNRCEQVPHAPVRWENNCHSYFTCGWFDGVTWGHQMPLQSVSVAMQGWYGKAYLSLPDHEG